LPSLSGRTKILNSISNSVHLLLSELHSEIESIYHREYRHRPSDECMVDPDEIDNLATSVENLSINRPNVASLLFPFLSFETFPSPSTDSPIDPILTPGDYSDIDLKSVNFYPIQPQNGSETTMEDTESRAGSKILSGEKLTKQNHEKWFDSLFFLTASMDADTCLDETQTENKSKSVNRLKEFKLMFAIQQGLTAVDRPLVSEFRTPASLLKQLKRKYQANASNIAAQYAHRYYTYKIDGESIQEAFAELRRFARLAATADNRHQHLKEESNVFRQLLESLPPSYDTVKDTLIARGIEKDKEVRIKESAHLTIERSRPKTRLRQSSQRRGRKSRRSSSSPENRSIRPKLSTLRYDLCDNEGHLIRDCLEFRTAKRLLRESRFKITLVDRSKTKRNRSRVRD